jgi:hypothetical protein
MAISLTKSEFQKRLAQRYKLLGTAMTEDMHECFKPPYYYMGEGMPVEAFPTVL